MTLLYLSVTTCTYLLFIIVIIFSSWSLIGALPYINILSLFSRYRFLGNYSTVVDCNISTAGLSHEMRSNDYALLHEASWFIVKCISSF